MNSGKYTAKYTYSTAGLKDYNTGSNTVTISKQKVSIAASDLVVKYNDGSSYQVTVQNKTGSPINGIKVLFNLNSAATEVATDENGVATLKYERINGADTEDGLLPGKFRIVEEKAPDTKSSGKGVEIDMIDL